jgi:hypothetical protein
MHDGVVRIELTAAVGPRLTKRILVSPDGHLEVQFEWDASAFQDGAVFTSEVSFSQFPPTIASDDGEIWWYPIETIAKSERGLDRTRQGMTAMVRWPVALGRGTLQIR